jgi:hypothetical protein
MIDCVDGVSSTKRVNVAAFPPASRGQRVADSTAKRCHRKLSGEGLLTTLRGYYACYAVGNRVSASEDCISQGNVSWRIIVHPCAHLPTTRRLSNAGRSKRSRKRAQIVEIARFDATVPNRSAVHAPNGACTAPALTSQKREQIDGLCMHLLMSPRYPSTRTSQSTTDDRRLPFPFATAMSLLMISDIVPTPLNVQYPGQAP